VCLQIRFASTLQEAKQHQLQSYGERQSQGKIEKLRRSIKKCSTHGSCRGDMIKHIFISFIVILAMVSMYMLNTFNDEKKEGELILSALKKPVIVIRD
jgi:hypothetical protein